MNTVESLTALQEPRLGVALLAQIWFHFNAESLILSEAARKTWNQATDEVGQAVKDQLEAHNV